jgi:hypothetical protein
VDAQPGRTPTSHAIQSEHCPLPTLTQLKPPFSASTSYKSGRISEDPGRLRVRDRER